VKYAARSLRKSPGFTVVAVLTLALGIGANTAIFSAIDARMLRPLPFRDADRIVRIYSVKGEVNGSANGGSPARGEGALTGPSVPDILDFANQSHSFEKMVVFDTWRKNVSFGSAAGEPEQMRVGLVPATYFEILGVEPMMGRLFTEEENRKNEHVAAISVNVWRNQYGGNLSILGRQIRINDEPYTIVGVMPQTIPEWMEPGRAGNVDVWTPLDASVTTLYPPDTLWLAVKQGLEMAAIGASLGLLGAIAAEKLTSGMLFGVSPVDPATFVGVAAFLMAVAAVASAIPGARAMDIEPARALRQG
jgi:MacB-like periplasmic core domain